MALAWGGGADELRRNSFPITGMPLSILCRVRFSNLAVGFHELVRISSGTTSQRYGVAVNSTGTVAVQISDGTPANAVATATVADTNWHTIYGVFLNSTSRTAYLDNANSATNTTSKSPASVDKICVGCMNDSNAAVQDNNGHELADVAVYNVADLTAAELAAYNEGVSPRLIRPQSLVYFDRLLSSAQDLFNNAGYTADVGLSEVVGPRLYYPKR